jgi:hypothetical protein
MLAKELKCPKPRCIVLQKTGWKIKGADGAAELLGIKPTTLISRIKKNGAQTEGAAMSLPRFDSASA